MKVIHEQKIEINPWKRPVVTVGNFDGLHQGHRQILKALKGRSEELGVDSVVITFYPHPARVLRPDRAPVPLCPLKDRIEAIKGAEVDGLWVIPFDRRFSNISARSFVKDYLVGTLGISGLVLGHDARFGKDRGGDQMMLTDLARSYDFFLDNVDDFIVQEERVSSTRIRQALVHGWVELVSELLGHPYRLKGEVTIGHRRGRQLGFPTANLWVEDVAVPGNGVYACFARIGAEPSSAVVHPCVTSIGTRPTFDNGPVSIEAHILDFEGNLYGMPLSLEFVGKLRDERRFSSVEALVEAMYRDVADARAILQPLLS